MLKSCVFSVSGHSASEGGERNIFKVDVSWSYPACFTGEERGLSLD